MQTYTLQQLKEAYFQGGRSANNLMKGLDYIPFEDWLKTIETTKIEQEKETTKNKRKK